MRSDEQILARTSALLDILQEKCWDGYKQVGLKKKVTAAPRAPYFLWHLVQFYTPGMSKPRKGRLKAQKSCPAGLQAPFGFHFVPLNKI